MNGKLVGGSIVLIALATGAGMLYAQLFAFYAPVAAGAPAAQVALVPVTGGAPEAILADGFSGIDATSSPLRFRGCFHTDLSLAMLSETYTLYPDPTPLNGPYWFDCFKADEIGADLEAGRAVAFLGQRDIAPGVDRVVAVYPDGRAVVWHQLNENAEK